MASSYVSLACFWALVWMVALYLMLGYLVTDLVCRLDKFSLHASSESITPQVSPERLK
jgi:hypothetical protein